MGTSPSWPGVIQAYREFMPVTEQTPIITLREGDTPLLPAPALQERIGLPIPLYLKYEGANPTGSFKDRGMTMAVSSVGGGPKIDRRGWAATCLRRVRTSSNCSGQGMWWSWSEVQNQT